MSRAGRGYSAASCGDLRLYGALWPRRALDMGVMGYTVATPCLVFLIRGADSAAVVGCLLGAGLSVGRLLGVGPSWCRLLVLGRLLAAGRLSQPATRTRRFILDA